MLMENSINIAQLQIILELSKKAVVKISKKGCFGSGFLCLVYLSEFKLLPVLISNNHLLNENDIIVGKKIDFSLNNDKSFYQILIDESRKVYTSSLYDVTFIEIKEKDGLSISSFLEIDRNIFSFDERELNNKQVSLLSYPMGKKLEFSNGMIKKLAEDGYHIYHLCSTTSGCAGGPIIDLKNNHVIAVHQGSNEKNHFNIGIFLKKPLEEFIKINN